MIARLIQILVNEILTFISLVIMAITRLIEVKNFIC